MIKLIKSATLWSGVIVTALMMCATPVGLGIAASTLPFMPILLILIVWNEWHTKRKLRGNSNGKVIGSIMRASTTASNKSPMKAG